MGNRLSRITTRTGDDGSTGLGDGSRVAKDCPRIALLGEVDELNSHLGVLLCEALSDSVHAQLVAIQHDLFDLGGEVAVPGHQAIDEKQVLRLERWLGVEHGGRADVWLGMQASYDLWTAEQKTKALIRKVKPLSVAVLAAV